MTKKKIIKQAFFFCSNNCMNISAALSAYWKITMRKFVAVDAW